jgi:hypothetical protein
MGYYQQQAFIGSRGVVSGVQVRRQAALGPTEDAFHMPTSPVFLRGKVALHILPMSTPSRGLGPASVVDRDDRFGDFPVLSAATVVFFGVVGGVAEKATNAGTHGRLLHGRQKAWRVVAGATANNSRQNEVTTMVDHNGELKVATETACPARASAAINEVAARIVSLQAGSVHADLARRRQQFQLPSATNDFS